MSSITLAQSAALCQNELIAGIVENVITVDRFYEILPFDGIDGNALAYNRELVLGDVGAYAVGDTITNKNPATFTQVTSSLTSIIGDAEVNGLVQATRSGQGNNQEAVQIASKAKAAGRLYRNMLINGTGSADQFTGLLGLCDPSKTFVQANASSDATNGGALTLATLDALINLVIDKDGEVDYFLMNGRTINSYFALLRSLGGARIDEVVALPSGIEVPAYRKIPIFRNDYVPLNQVQGTSTACTSVAAGTLDDGSRKYGISGLTALNAAGMQVERVGVHQSRDEMITRVKWYAGLALFNLNGLAVATGITN